MRNISDLSGLTFGKWKVISKASSATKNSLWECLCECGVSKLVYRGSQWRSRTEQANNTRSNRLITHNGETKTLSEWARCCGIGESTIRRRLGLGWAMADALAKGIRVPAQVTHSGFTGSLKAVAEHFGCNYKAVHHKINKQGCTLEEAIAKSKK